MSTQMNTNAAQTDAASASLLRPALSLFLILSVVTGLLYPLLVTGLGQALFAQQAAGSLVKRGDQVVGSALIGQTFTDPNHFWGRPSATAPEPYNAAGSGGSNQGPLNPALADAVTARIAALRAADPGNTAPVPADLVTASGSGLDPHISVAAAEYQVARVAAARHMPVVLIQSLVTQYTVQRQFGLFGEPTVNVLLLNLALDTLKQTD